MQFAVSSKKPFGKVIRHRVSDYQVYLMDHGCDENMMVPSVYYAGEQ